MLVPERLSLGGDASLAFNLNNTALTGFGRPGEGASIEAIVPIGDLSISERDDLRAKLPSLSPTAQTNLTEILGLIEGKDLQQETQEDAITLEQKVALSFEQAMLEAGLDVERLGDRVVLQGAGGSGPLILENGITDQADAPLQVGFVEIFVGGSLDFGDAPLPYRSLVSVDGPRHVITNNLYLGRESRRIQMLRLMI